MVNEAEQPKRRGRRPRTVEEEWYDIFANADLAEQAVMLRVIGQIHRQVRRGKFPPAEQLNLTEKEGDAE